MKQREKLDVDIRFLLANERTLLAWLRTGLALQAGGVALIHFNEESKALGLSIIALGGITSIIGYTFTPKATLGPLTEYLGLGDSYTSGEGAYNYRAGTDTPDNKCHLSSRSYPELLINDLFNAASGHSVACSGARIRDIGTLNASYRGQAKNSPSKEVVLAEYKPGYIAQHSFAKYYQPRVMTVSVGGNDIGFGNILHNCVAPHVSLSGTNNTCYNTYEDRLEVLNLIDRTIPAWTNLYHQLQRDSPATTIYAIGYPKILAEGGNCALNVQLNQSEIEFATFITTYLNAAIAKAAKAANVSYVDISSALVGHRLCETKSFNIAVNGIVAGHDSGPFGIRLFANESYHPNALGHELIEQAILQRTQRLASHSSDTGESIDRTNILNKPKSGRQIYNLVPEEFIYGSVRGGKPVTIELNATEVGLTGSAAVAHLDGPYGPVIGQLTINTDGFTSGTVVIPTGTSGGHTIDIIGNNNIGEPVNVTQPIYVPHEGDDGDGDGAPDSSDTCSTLINSQHDTDHDGVDDICDNSIDIQPITPSETEQSELQPTLINSPGVSNIIIGSTSPKITKLSLSPASAQARKTISFSPASVRRLTTPSNKQNYALPKLSPATFGVLPIVPWIKWCVFIGSGWILSVSLHRLYRILRPGS